MKVDLIRKYRWYIVGLIMSFIMISISLSFCIWDDNSLNNLKASGSSGDYKHVPAYKLVDDIYSDDILTSGQNNIANVGDIVTFGKYYQDTEGVVKTPIRWIVVDSIGGTLTLLTENVVAFGNFDYRQYNNETGIKWDGEEKFNQRYNDSAIRAWLNSENRTDGGEGFIANDSKKVFNGFYREAFETNIEKNAIIPRNLGAMAGYSDKYKDNGEKFQYDSLDNQKVWIPSWTEVYGTVDFPGVGEFPRAAKVMDADSDRQFTYFKSVSGCGVDPKKVGTTTPFASTASISNYSTKLATHQNNSQGVSKGSITPVWWWLRSPRPDVNYDLVLVFGGGEGSRGATCHPQGGVRPAICLAR